MVIVIQYHLLYVPPNSEHGLDGLRIVTHSHLEELAKKTPRISKTDLGDFYSDYTTDTLANKIGDVSRNIHQWARTVCRDIPHGVPLDVLDSSNFSSFFADPDKFYVIKNEKCVYLYMPPGSDIPEDLPHNILYKLLISLYITDLVPANSKGTLLAYLKKLEEEAKVTVGKPFDKSNEEE